MPPPLTRFGTSSALTTAINHIEDFLRDPELGATITKMFDGTACRSTSVGDMVLLSSGKKYKCEMTGWSEV